MLLTLRSTALIATCVRPLARSGPRGVPAKPCIAHSGPRVIVITLQFCPKAVGSPQEPYLKNGPGRITVTYLWPQVEVLTHQVKVSWAKVTRKLT